MRPLCRRSISSIDPYHGANNGLIPSAVNSAPRWKRSSKSCDAAKLTSKPTRISERMWSIAALAPPFTPAAGKNSSMNRACGRSSRASRCTAALGNRPPQRSRILVTSARAPRSSRARAASNASDSVIIYPMMSSRSDGCVAFCAASRSIRATPARDSASKFDGTDSITGEPGTGAPIHRPQNFDCVTR